jgi:transcription antitermination factor NusG
VAKLHQSINKMMALMNSTSANWYTIYTFPRFEKRVCSELNDRHIEAYLPLQKVFRKWSDRIKMVEMPLFPSYVFVKTTDADRLKWVSIKGLCKFVSFAGKAAKISDDDIHTIKRLENEKLEVECGLIEGSRVRIIRGPLAGLKGVLFSKNGKERFGVRVEAIQETLSLEVSSIFLEKA